MADVTKFPIKAGQRLKNRRGALATSCEVSGRWIKFRGKPARLEAGVLAFADIMTEGDNGDRKICEFCFNLTELEALIAKLKKEAD